MEGGDHPSHLTHVERVDVVHRKHSQHHHFQYQPTVATARRPADAVGIFFVIVLSCSTSSAAGAASRARHSPRWSIRPLHRYTCRCSPLISMFHLNSHALLRPLCVTIHPLHGFGSLLFQVRFG